MKKIAVAMSGGVDSSVAALLLKQQGWDVLGIFMKNWEDDVDSPDYRRNQVSGCTWEQDFHDMRQVCQMINIEYTTFNFVQEYKEKVFNFFLEELKNGRTPNPDILCNQEIKFQLFLDKALALPGVNHISTGHFARIKDDKLMRPVDLNKDQTYFLYRISPECLDKVVFPLSELTKDQVRKIAAEHNFSNADKKDSTGICFIGDINYQDFIDQYIKKEEGDIVNMQGEVIGKHHGLHHYTLGQRRGINIGGIGPFYVAEKKQHDNILVVTNIKDDPILFHSSCQVTDLHWLQEVELPIECDVQIRYRQKAEPARLKKSNNGVVVEFVNAQRAITPGQAAVFYKDKCVLGGGVINSL